VLISIISINYNNAAGLARTIESVRNLECGYDLSYELIVIDGGSNDMSINVIENNKDIITYSVSEKDDGLYDAMNKGIRVARGKWINFMNSGDEFFNADVLNDIFIKISPADFNGKSMIYGNKYSEGFPVVAQSINLLSVGVINACHQSMFFLNRGLEYDIRYKIYGDYDYVLNCLAGNFERALFVPIYISVTEPGGIGSRSSKIKRKEKFHIVYKYFGLNGIFKTFLYSIINRIYYIFRSVKFIILK
jgi:glycosyltransferase involved in cell wall biosynthesis